MFDLVIRNGLVVDGTGRPGIVADVAIQRGRIAEIGRIEASGTETIDAAGLVVCPGFIDPHTHYDPQIAWDRLLGSSAEHGVTTVLMGNCGVGVAPCRAADRELLVHDLVNVEGMSADVLNAGIVWQWETFPQYLDAAARRGSGINLAFLAPLAPFRTWVLGPEANERPADAQETAAIADLLREAVEAGAFGFSTTAIPGHVGHHGKPLAARLASREELVAYCGTLKSMGRGIIELALTKRHGLYADDEHDLLELLVNESGRKVSWLSMHNMAGDPDNVRRVLDRVEPLMRRGAIPQILTRPLIAEMSLKRPFHFGEIGAAKGVFDQSLERQMQIYSDPSFRAAFRAELALGRKFTNQAPTVGVFRVGRADLGHYVGRSMSEIAAERGCDPLDCIFDIAVEDRLETVFFLPRANTDRARIAEALRDSEHTLIGLSDAGAHVDMMCEAGYPTYLLGHWVREAKALTLEHAVKRLTSEPADYIGFTDRGRLAPGLAADIVVFDAGTVGSPERPSLAHDLPAGGARMVAPAQGIRRVIVNGTTLYRDGAHTGAYPGRVLRAN
jgi:N-acyl-D-amino-acid deacylase